MKFRTVRRLMYLKIARHRRGHGIHSPFLFRLITTVVEGKRKLPEYEILKELKKSAFGLLENYQDPFFRDVYHQFKIVPGNGHQLYRKIELPARYVKIVFRLIREFKPSVIVNYGPALGVNLALLAMANNDAEVYQVNNDPACEKFSRELPGNSAISNIHFVQEDTITAIVPEFVNVNYPYNPDMSRYVIRKIMEKHSKDEVMIIRGIHESLEMEANWKEVTERENVRVSLDLFEIGIVLFRDGLQKENFIHRF